MANFIKKKIEAQIKALPVTLPKNKREANNSTEKIDERTFKEKVEAAEKQYQEVKKENVEMKNRRSGNGNF